MPHIRDNQPNSPRTGSIDASRNGAIKPKTRPATAPAAVQQNKDNASQAKSRIGSPLPAKARFQNACGMVSISRKTQAERRTADHAGNGPGQHSPVKSCRPSPRRQQHTAEDRPQPPQCRE